MQEMELFDLTNPQKSIWYTEEVFKGTTINNICTSGLIYEKIDLDLLKKAINLVVKQNDSFRIHVVLQDGNVKQYISDYKNFDIDIKYINSSDELKNAQQEEAKHVFNMIDSDLFKFKIVVLKDVFVCVVLTANHIISDSWSMGITIQEILRNYHELQNCKSADLGGVFKDSNNADFEDDSNSSSGNGFEVYSYANYINSEKAYKNSQKFENDKKFWKNIFETIPEQASIPGSLPKQFEQSKSIGNTYNATNIANSSNATNIANPSNSTNPANDISTSSLLNVEPSYAAERLSFGIDKDLMSKINAFCKKNHFSVFSFFMALFSLYIGRVSNSDDFVIGTPILNRVNPKEKRTTGMFVNTAPVRVNLLNDDTFANFASSFSQKMMGILRHQKYSYNSILEDIRSNHKNVPNLYNILISYQVTKAFDSQFGNYKTDWTFNKSLANDMNIHIYDINDTGSVLISYDYLLSKYCLQDIKDLHARIVNMINQVLENNEILSCNIDIVTQAEKKKILYDFNDTFKDFPKNKTIVELFEAQVEKTPDNVALVFEDKKMTYMELNERANCLASFLRHQKNIGRNDLVGIMCNRSFEMIISILAVLKAGGAYIPIDPTFPRDRINYMLENSKAKVLLTQKHLDDAVVFDDKTFVDLDEALFDDRACSNLKPISKPDDLAYVIYTSGSTGVPKGVMLKQSNIVNFIYGMMNEFKFKPTYTMVSITTISFDIFVLESLLPLLNGLKVVITNEQEQIDIKLFNKLCLKNNVDIIQTTPSRMQTFLTSTNDLGFVKNAKFVLIGGEPFPAALLNSIKKISDCKIYNMYGPTETAVWSTMKNLTNTDKITIGHPIANTQVYILDKCLKPVPFGVTGEIYIAGDGVSKGYLNNLDLTTRSFVTNPFLPNTFVSNSFAPKCLMYKTGDLGKFDYDGEIICLGRLDNQVKIRGLRIELGEIEDRINELSFIDSCVVVKKNLSLTHETLCAYFTSNNKMTNTQDYSDEVIKNFQLEKHNYMSEKNISDAIVKHLESFLPRYMIPSYFIQMEQLPYTPNGKIDRKRLPDPEIGLTKNLILPRNNIDAKLIDLLKSLLHVDSISIDDNFFELGGDSLSAITLCAQLQNVFNVHIFVKDVLEKPKIQDLSDIVSEYLRKNKSILQIDGIDEADSEALNVCKFNKQINSIKTVKKSDFYATSSSQKRMYYASQTAGSSSILYNLPGGIILEGFVDVNRLENCLNILIDRHEALRTFFKIVDNTVVQKVLDKTVLDFKIIENANFDNLRNLFGDFVRPFDLSKAPLFRAEFIKFTNNKSVLFIDMHHIISDGASLNILTDELFKLYNGEVLPELKITYKDFAVFENDRLSSGILKDAENYWVSQFKDEIPVLNMPTNRPRPAIQSFEGAKVYSFIDDNNAQKIKNLSEKLGITPYMLLLSCYNILLSKYTSQDDIVVGSPVSCRDFAETCNLIGMFVNTIALRNKVDGSKSFKEFVLSVKDKVLEAIDYQNFPFDELVNKLDIDRDASRNPLFDTMFIYQNNGYKNLDLKNIKASYYIPDTDISKFDLSVEVVPENTGIRVSFEYATSLFDKVFIENLANNYLNILNIVLDNIDIRISDISVLSEKDKNKILYEFNDTFSDFPKDKTVLDLFENQVKNNPDNIAVVFEGKKLTYKELNEKSDSFAHFLKTKNVSNTDVIGIKLNRSFNLIIAIFAVIKSGACYVLIDNSFPEERIKYILSDSNAKYCITDNSSKDNYINIKNYNFSNYGSQISFHNKNLATENNYSNIKCENNNDLCIIYTSGSTGVPKGVKLHHTGFINLIYGFDKEMQISTYKNILGIATVSFDMFAVELFSSILFGNSLILANEEEQRNPSAMSDLIINNNVEFFITTPSRIEILLKYKSSLKNVKAFQLGGEEFTDNLYNKLIKCTNAKMFNGYGPTEITACCTNKRISSGKITIGKPISNVKVYICDKYTNLLPVGVIGEICVAGLGISNGYVNNIDATRKNFVNNPYGDGFLYKTGDLGKYCENGEIEYIGRADTQVKIRGLRIELSEIENKILDLPFINKCVVLKKTDMHSHDYLCAYFTSNTKFDTNSIRKYLDGFLPKYMIPRAFVQIDNIPYTVSGKLDRKKLPEPQINSLKKDIIKPKNAIESKLIDLLKDLLEVKSISMNDDFFDLGGDSLSAINLCTSIQSEIGVNLQVKDILENTNIQNLSNLISEHSKHANALRLVHTEKSEFYPTSSAQKRIYFTCKMAGDGSIAYNTPGGVILDGDVDICKLEKCINQMINRHESLRTYFEVIDNNVVQKIKDAVSFKLEVIDGFDFNDIDTVFRNFVKPFDLSIAPLFRANFIHFTNGKSAIFIDMHHIISDGYSLSIFIDEVCKLYNGISLKELDFTYKDFAVFENEELKSGNLDDAKNYWIKQFSGEIPVLNMPTQFSRPAVQSFEGGKVYFVLDSNITKKIEIITKHIGITPYMFLLSCYYILLSKYTSQDDIIVGSPIVGRNISETNNIIGMFANTLALRNKIDNSMCFKDFSLSIKNSLLQAFKYQTYPFDELVNNLNIKRDTSRNVLFDTMFIYQNNGFKQLDFGGLNFDYYIPDSHVSKFDLSLEAIPVNDCINLSFEYATSLFNEDFIKNMSTHYLNIINCVLDNYDVNLSDIDILSNSERNRILYDFNNTYFDYPKEKTLSILFENQVERTPDNIAIVFENKSLTYRELNNKANSLAYYLRYKKNIKNNDLVGIMCNRSIEMIIAILAVLKAGGAYIPIDPSFPEDRVSYMLKEGNCKLLLTLKKLDNRIDFYNKLFVDLKNNSIYDVFKENLLCINNPEDLAYVIFTSGSTGKPKGVALKHVSLSNLTNYCNNYIDYLKNPSYKAIVSITTISFDIFIFETLISLQKGLKLIIANEDEQTTPSLLNKLIDKYNVKIIQSTPSRMQIFMNNIDYIPCLRNLEYITLAGEQLPLELVRNLHSLSNSVIYNGYGPSETTVFSTLTKMDGDKITIGKPLNNTQFYILDNYLKPTPIGVSGEIYISGDGVGKGYLNNKDLTSKCFIENPFVPGTLMYKSGDLGMFNDDGSIICLGRLDNQVKIRGLRIELGEIEALLLQHPLIEKVAVVKQIVNFREFISCYFVANKSVAIPELRKYLSKILPKYMVPSYFIALNDLPYTPNGKIDRRSLPLPTEILNISKDEYVAPKTKLQKDLVNVFEKVLNTRPIGVNANFFELGGDSLLAMTLNIELSKISNNVSYQDIFRFPTILELEEKITSNDNSLFFNKIENLSTSCADVLKDCTKKEKFKKYHPKNILITGSTGFLGIHILDEFIRKEKGNVYCIVRDSPGVTARTKLYQKLHYYFGNKYDDLLDKRIFAITGNISEPGFGLSQEDLLNLANSVDVLINCAAVVSHFGNYNVFYKVNVTSVKYAIDFCKSFNKKLYHISTISVSGTKLDLSYPAYNKKTAVTFDESCLYVGQILDNVYSRSKFEAETLVLNAINNGLDGYLLRIGHLTSRYKDGLFQENYSDNALLSKLLTFIKIGAVPDYLLNNLLEFTPVDSASKAIYKIISHPTKKNRVFNLYNTNFVTVKRLKKLFDKKFFTLDVLPENEFVNKINLLLNDDVSKNILKNLIDDFDNNLHLDYNSDITVKSDFTIKYLKRAFYRWPKLNNKYLIRFINIITKEL